MTLKLSVLSPILDAMQAPLLTAAGQARMRSKGFEIAQDKEQARDILSALGLSREDEILAPSGGALIELDTETLAQTDTNRRALTINGVLVASFAKNLSLIDNLKAAIILSASKERRVYLHRAG